MLTVQQLGRAGELIARRVIESRPTLKADQHEMVRRVLSSPEWGGWMAAAGEFSTAVDTATA